MLSFCSSECAEFFVKNRRRKSIKSDLQDCLRNYTRRFYNLYIYIFIYLNENISRNFPANFFFSWDWFNLRTLEKRKIDSNRIYFVLLKRSGSLLDPCWSSSREFSEGDTNYSSFEYLSCKMTLRPIFIVDSYI